MKKHSVIQYASQSLLALVLASFLVSSCGYVARPVIKQTGKFLLATLFLAAAEELLAEDLNKLFDEAPEEKEPINITIVNDNDQSIALDLTNDGAFWKKDTLLPKGKTTFKSTKKGLVGVKTDDVYFALREGKYYKAVMKEGKLVIEEIPDAETPTEVMLYNRQKNSITLEVTNDGKTWKTETIAAQSNKLLESAAKGIIGIKSGDGYIVLRGGKSYTVSQKRGEININEIQ